MSKIRTYIIKKLTSPKTTCLPSSQGVGPQVMKTAEETSFICPLMPHSQIALSYESLFVLSCVCFVIWLLIIQSKLLHQWECIHQWAHHCVNIWPACWSRSLEQKLLLWQCSEAFRSRRHKEAYTENHLCLVQHWPYSIVRPIDDGLHIKDGIFSIAVTHTDECL